MPRIPTALRGGFSDKKGALSGRLLHCINKRLEAVYKGIDVHSCTHGCKQDDIALFNAVTLVVFMAHQSNKVGTVATELLPIH